jgi:hypothetical protein
MNCLLRPDLYAQTPTLTLFVSEIGAPMNYISIASPFFRSTRMRLGHLGSLSLDTQL